MTKARALSPPELVPANDGQARRLGRQMRRLHGLISSRMMSGLADRMQDDELSFSQMATLFHLYHGPQRTVSRLAGQTRLSVAAASHLIERLVQRGLVEREENPENRREKLVALSAAGRRTLDEMQARTAEAYAAALGHVPAEVLAQAEEALNTLLSYLTPEDGPDSPCSEVTK